MSAAPPVVVESLDHHYGTGALRRQILFDVSATIPAGEIIIVTGPSGSGKTTLLTLVGALRAAQSGSVRVLGQELKGARDGTLEQVRRRIGFIFQQHNLLAALTATENVELGLRATGSFARSELRTRARAMLEAVGLGAHADKRPHQLSGGQRQRVAIARALVGDPAIVLADEPTASLDKTSGREVVERMQSLAREQGATILIVTHDNRILDVADRILHLEDGRISTFTEAVIANTRAHDGPARREREQGASRAARGADGRSRVPRHAAGAHAAVAAIPRGHRARARPRPQEPARAGAPGIHAPRSRTARCGAGIDVPRGSRSRRAGAARLPGPRAGETVRIPIGSGIAGAAAASGRPVRVADAYQDPRFNRNVDVQTGFRTRSVLCLPLHDRSGNVFAVTQLLNRRDGRPFDEADEARYADFAGSLGVLLESLVEMGGEPTA